MGLSPEFFRLERVFVKSLSRYFLFSLLICTPLHGLLVTTITKTSFIALIKLVAAGVGLDPHDCTSATSTPYYEN